MSFFETLLKLQGFPIDEAKQKIAEVSKLSHEGLVKYQEERKWEMLDFHYKTNPFYKKKCKNGIPASWDEVPIMKKKELQVPIEAFLNPQYTLKQVYTSKTSGSTGVPLIFAKDKFAHAISWAIILQRYGVHGIHAGDKQARFYGIPLQGIPYYKERLKDFLGNRLRFIVHDLSDNVLLKFIEKFEKVPFKYLYGYTNSLKLFAQIIVKNNLVLKDICPTIECCVVTSEVCTPEDKILLKKAFGVPILNEYGASELGIIAFPDKNHDWKISDEEFFVEILDDHGIPVEREQEGRIVLTSLYNKAMPFVRYELGDIASINKTDKGKFLKNLHGRLNDTVRLPSGKIVPGFTLYYASKALMANMKGLKEYNIKQTAIDTIEYDIVAEADFDEKLVEMIEKVTYKYLEPGLKVKVNKVDAIKRTAAGKFKHFQSYIDSPEIVAGKP
ncbi:MAG: phenylacetate--CoA ligase family protein [Bacteroidota bacterium]|nr:phenylacetate--CoA ligase family protein [Bacteroidota bacterium]